MACTTRGSRRWRPLRPPPRASAKSRCLGTRFKSLQAKGVEWCAGCRLFEGACTNGKGGLAGFGKCRRATDLRRACGGPILPAAGEVLIARIAQRETHREWIARCHRSYIAARLLSTASVRGTPNGNAASIRPPRASSAKPGSWPNSCITVVKRSARRSAALCGWAAIALAASGVDSRSSRGVGLMSEP